MTRLTYLIKCHGGAYLKDKDTEEIIQTPNWEAAKAFARAVKGEVIPHYEEKRTY